MALITCTRLLSAGNEVAFEGKAAEGLYFRFLSRLPVVYEYYQALICLGIEDVIVILIAANNGTSKGLMELSRDICYQNIKITPRY